MLKYVFIAGTLALTAYGQIILKYRATVLGTADTGAGKLNYLVAMFGDVGVLSGLLAAMLASVFWMLVVQQTPVSFAYPFMALSFVIVPLLAVPILGEAVSVGQWCGMLLIVAGVSVAAIAK